MIYIYNNYTYICIYRQYIREKPVFSKLPFCHLQRNMETVIAASSSNQQALKH